MANIAYGEITILDLLDDATYIYYADDDSGGGVSLSPTGKSYIGIYSGSALSTGQPAPDTSEYTNIKGQIKWSKYVGEDGEPGKDGTSVNQNLYTGSAQFSGEWVNKSGWTETEEVDSLGNKIFSKLGPYGGLFQYVNASKGDTFTLSGNVKNSANEKIHFYVVEYDADKNKLAGGESVDRDYRIDVTTQEQRYSGTYTIQREACRYISMRLESENNTNTLYVSSLKLEHGDTATEWCPAINGIISTMTTYQLGESATTAPGGSWSTSPPTLESGKFLWTKTELLLEDGTTSVSYSVGARGEDGQDGDKYLIETSHERILKFKTKQGMEFSPVTLGFSVYELTEDEPIAITFKTNPEEDTQRKASFKIQILASDGVFYNVPEDYDHSNKLIETDQDKTEKIPSFFLLGFYNFLVEQASISTTSLGEDLTKQGYSSVLTALESTSTYIRFVYLENGVEKAFKPVEIANGVSDDMAEFNITATEINAAVQDRVMSFDATGLHILNGGFDIKAENYKKVQFKENEGFSEKVEYYEYDSENKKYILTTDEIRDTTKTYYIKNQDLLLGYLKEGLYVNGTGIFSGEIQASSGSFEGTITASGGEIGGFTIGQDTLTSKDGGLVLQGGGNSKISVDSIELGSNATVTDYIQLGNGVKLYGDSKSSNVFEIKEENGEISTSLLTITRQGNLILGDESSYLVLDGKNRTISTSNYSSSDNIGKGWYLSEGKSYFNDVVVRGKLETAVFETGKVSAVGGILLVRPSTKIESIETVNGKSIIKLEDATGFTGASTNSPEYYYLAATSGEAIYCYTTEKITGGKITLTSEIGDEYINATIVNYGQAGSVGLGINGSTNDGAVPSSSFSVFEWTPELKEENGVTTVDAEKNYRVILGKLPADEKYKDFAGKYGLYAENVLLKGALVAETAGTQKVYSGISTADQDEPPQSSAALFSDSQSEILLWAGAQGTDKEDIEKSNFYVDRNGNLYANSGYFSGTVITDATIETSKLKAAHIIGADDENALIVQDDVGTAFLTSNGDPIMSIGSSGVSIAEGINFSIGNSTFNSGEWSTSSLLISNPEKTNASVKIYLPNSNETSDKGKISFSNSLTEKKDNEPVDQLTEDYAILESQGLHFQANGANILSMTGNDFLVNRDIYLAKDVCYGENVKYKQVVDNGKVIGYDLYI